jgi:hypothetical protein
LLIKKEREKSRKLKFERFFFISKKKHPTREKNSKLDLFLDDDDDISNIKHKEMRERERGIVINT